MTRVPAGKSTSTRRSPQNRVRGALSRSRVTKDGWFMGASGLGRLGQIEARPRVRLGHQGQATIGIHGGGVADDAQHRDVRVAVAERETVVEVVPLGSRVVA